jgi:NADPH:quinone reductase-like Zn-dependent oxidoreductase
VIGTASANNQDYVRSLGAETVIDYQTTPFETVVHDVDVVLDTIGGDVQDRSWQVLRPGGILVSIVGPLSPEKAQVHGVRIPAPGRPDPSRAGAALREVSSLLDSGQVRMQVAQVLPLAEASRAHAISETRHGRGHIVLHIAG